MLHIMMSMMQFVGNRGGSTVGTASVGGGPGFESGRTNLEINFS